MIKGLVFLAAMTALVLPSSAQITGGSCTASNLTGAYTLSLTGRAIGSTGSLTSLNELVGTATFDGASKVTFTGTSNSNQAIGKAITYSGSFSLSSTCVGTLTLNSGLQASFTITTANDGSSFNLDGSDATYAYTGSGTANYPLACNTATLSGSYVYTANGFALSGSTFGTSQDEAGVFNFDGAGNVTVTFAITPNGSTATQYTATGTYSVKGCQATATLADNSGKANSLAIVISGAHADSLTILESNSGYLRLGTAHSTFLNPSESIGNVASYYIDSTPPGSVFVIYGQNFAAREVGASTTPLPVTLLNTSVTVNGIAAPLFYVGPGQIDAQMPWEIPGNSVATVVVKNGTSTSAAASVYVPSTGTPGLSVYGNNRAVVVNPNGSVNSSADTAAVGDEVVTYFTGGGPINSPSKPVTGSPAANGLSPITGKAVVMIGTVPATIRYVGLTPGAIGLYQVNFIVPQIAKGTYPVTLTIAGYDSNKPVITISN